MNGGKMGSKRVLLKSGWQTINIGDITHTPGTLAAFEAWIPDVELWLWPAAPLDRGAQEMIQRRFPDVRIVYGSMDEYGRPVDSDLAEAFDRCDLFVSGSGASMGQPQAVAQWSEHTEGKPWGVFGVSLSPIGNREPEIDPRAPKFLSQAAFTLCRETTSLALARDAGVESPILDLGYDGTFQFDISDDASAEAYLQSAGLSVDRYICVIPRLRWTPYYQIRSQPPTSTDLSREQESQEHRESDLAAVRQAMITFVRETGLQVLVCPEMIHEIRLGKDVLVDPLPRDVRQNVVLREEYWLPDEARSVYSRACGVVSLEMHSPIIAATVATPAVHIRQPTDTPKGQMWRDVGFGDWLFDVETVTSDALSSIMISFANSLADHREYVRVAHRRAVEHTKANVGRIVDAVW